MKFLSQAMDVPLTVMMVPPWAGIPTSWINTHAQFSQADKYTAHVYTPVLHKTLAMYLDKDTTRQDSCDGEKHSFF